MTSLVNDILMPPISALMGNTDFSNLKVDLSAVRNAISAASDAVVNSVTGGEEVVEKAVEIAPIYWNYGAFIQQCIDFFILAFCVFMMVKMMNRIVKKEEAKPAAPAPAPAPSKEEVLLTEIRDLLKEKK